jgi:hypothetical protein
MTFTDARSEALKGFGKAAQTYARGRPDITQIIAPYEGDAPRYYKGEWRRSFSGQLFSDLSDACFAYQHIGTPQQVILDRILSLSFIAA